MTINDENDVDVLRCSFCNKSQYEVIKLIAGPSVFICNECVELCIDIVETEFKTELDYGLPIPSPHEIYKMLSEYVVGQEHTKTVLAVAVYNHYKRLDYIDKYKKHDDVELGKSNILLVGPTGSGKTLLAHVLSKILHVPCVEVSATTLTSAGYVGEDVENIISKLLVAADNDISRAQKGIVCIDEIDKLRRTSDSLSATKDVSGEGVQHALLSIIEGTVSSVPLRSGRKHPHQEFVQVDTSNILFICCGAFTDIEKIVHRRLSQNNAVGFSANILPKKIEYNNIMPMVQVEDFLQYGMIREFIGRFSNISVLDGPNEATLLKILTEPKNALVKQYQKFYALHNCELEINDEACSAIVKKSIGSGTGARGLRAELDQVLLSTNFNIIEFSKKPARITVTKESVEKKSDVSVEYIKKKSKASKKRLS